MRFEAVGFATGKTDGAGGGVDPWLLIASSRASPKKWESGLPSVAEAMPAEPKPESGASLI
jgi:hypothetical protein